MDPRMREDDEHVCYGSLYAKYFSSAFLRVLRGEMMLMLYRE